MVPSLKTLEKSLAATQKKTRLKCSARKSIKAYNSQHHSIPTTFQISLCSFCWWLTYWEAVNMSGVFISFSICAFLKKKSISCWTYLLVVMFSDFHPLQEKVFYTMCLFQRASLESTVKISEEVNETHVDPGFPTCI